MTALAPEYAAQESRKAILAIERLIDFAQYTWPGYQRAHHVGVVADALEAIERGEIDRLMIFMAPRHGKSELVSVRYPAWFMCRHPERFVVGASYVAGGTPNLPEFEGEGGNPGVGTQVSAVISIYGPSDLVGGGASEAISSLMGTDASEEEMRAASPVSYATPDYPPTMLIHGTADVTVPWQSSLRMHEALQEAGVPVDVHYFAEQPHAFDREPAYGRQTASLMRLFLARYMGVPQEA